MIKRLVKVGQIAVGFRKNYSRRREVFRFSGVIEIRPLNDKLPVFTFALAPYQNRLDALQHLADVLEQALMGVRFAIVKMKTSKKIDDES